MENLDNVKAAEIFKPHLRWRTGASIFTINEEVKTAGGRL
jgi:hypothetical protein